MTLSVLLRKLTIAVKVYKERGYEVPLVKMLTIRRREYNIKMWWYIHVHVTYTHKNIEEETGVDVIQKSKITMECSLRSWFSLFPTKVLMNHLGGGTLTRTWKKQHTPATWRIPFVHLLFLYICWGAFKNEVLFFLKKKKIYMYKYTFCQVLLMNRPIWLQVNKPKQFLNCIPFFLFFLFIIINFQLRAFVFVLEVPS